MDTSYSAFNFIIRHDGDSSTNAATDDDTFYYFDGVNVTDTASVAPDDDDDPIDLVWDFTDTDVRSSSETPSDGVFDLG